MDPDQTARYVPSDRVHTGRRRATIVVLGRIRVKLVIFRTLTLYLTDAGNIGDVCFMYSALRKKWHLHLSKTWIQPQTTAVSRLIS